MKIIDWIVIGILSFLIGYIAMGGLLAMKRTPEWDEGDWKAARLVITLNKSPRVGSTQEIKEKSEVVTKCHGLGDSKEAPKRVKDVLNTRNGSTSK